MKQLTLATLIGVFLSLPAAATCLGKEALPAAKSFATRHHDFYTADPVKLYGKIEARLLAALAADYRCRDGEICAISADPWIAAQDGDIRNPEFTLISATELRAQVEPIFLS